MSKSKSNFGIVLSNLLSRLDYRFAVMLFISIFSFFIFSIGMTYTKYILTNDYGDVTTEIYARALDWIPLASSGFLYKFLLAKFNQYALDRLAIISAYICLIFAFRPNSIKKMVERY